jgi:RNA polymerase sigma factor (sigma-70 family)
MQKPTDIQSIVKGCCLNQPQAQKLLVVNYSGILLSVARRYAPDSSAAEDILQEAFILIFKHIHTFKNEISSLENWLKKIVVNTALKEFRKKHIRFEISTDSFDENQSQVPDAFKNMDFERIMKLIQKLPAGYREIFNLYVFEEYSHEEISQMLGISSGTSRSQLARARKILQEQVQVYYNELERI